MNPARHPMDLAFVLLALTSLASASLPAQAADAPLAGAASLPAPGAPDLPRLLAAARGVMLASLDRGIPAEDAADAASLLVSDVLRARRENPALVDRVAATVSLEMLAIAPASPPLAVGPLRLSRHVAREALGARAGRNRLAILGRLRGAIPTQAGLLSDEELMELLPALVDAAEPVAVPADLLAPLRQALAAEPPQ